MEQINTGVKKLRFLHIPKTAGSSFTACLRRIYGRGKYFFGFTGKLEEDLTRYAKLESKSDIRLFAGHTFYPVGVKEIDELSTITFLREPISRVKSFCRHVSKGKGPQLLKSFPPERFSLDDFLVSGYEELNNLQVRVLTGYRGEITEQNCRQLVTRAVDVLQNDLVSFGLTEKFDASLMMFRMIFNWPWPTYRVVNKGKKLKPLVFRDEHVAKIMELNAADSALYKAASDIFDARIHSKKDEISVWLEEFKWRQRIFQIYSWIYGIAGHVRKKLAPPEWYIAAHRDST